MGPDVDAGFRLAKLAHPGVMVISAELAWLLAETAGHTQVQGGIVGWKQLKSVWNDNPYPIIWITLPPPEDKDEQRDYDMFDPWENTESEFVRKWEQYTEDIRQRPLPISGVRDDIARTIKRLPVSLGIVEPYIASKHEIPESHKVIRKILEGLFKKADDSQSGMESRQLGDLKKSQEDIAASVRELEKEPPADIWRRSFSLD